MKHDVNLLNERQATRRPPIDKYGRPTTYLAYRILKYMFSHRDKSLTSEKLNKLMAAKISDTKLICRKLKDFDMLTEDISSEPSKYQYNLDCANSNAQAAFERFLVEVETEALPVHLMLDYSPSYRFRGDLYDGYF